MIAAKGAPVQRKPLKHTDYEVDLHSRTVGDVSKGMLETTQRHWRVWNCEVLCVDYAIRFEDVIGPKNVIRLLLRHKGGWLWFDCVTAKMAG
ncbi:hypothetical protein Tco_0097270 [Tanacetum coccineum]